MEFFIQSMTMIMETFRQDFTLYGFTFSFWDIMILIMVSSIVVSFLSRMFR